MAAEQYRLTGSEILTRRVRPREYVYESLHFSGRCKAQLVLRALKMELLVLEREQRSNVQSCLDVANKYKNKNEAASLAAAECAFRIRGEK